MLPGYPVAAIVNAVQFLRPALRRVGHLPQVDHPTTEAELGRKVTSEPGTRSFVRVSLEEDDGESGGDAGDGESGGDADRPTATPTRASGAGVLSSVALADGWVVVPEELEGYDAGTTVSVENWEWSA
jgi:molybdopterin molybdotransferase